MRWDQNNEDGGSCIEKSENGFIFLAFCIFCDFRQTHLSPSGAGMGIIIDWFVLRNRVLQLDLAQHSRIILVVNPGRKVSVYGE